ncbi:alpha/beta hydrolase [Lancefieldella sp. Marseille-Q7238]|uniref:alpha/beta hydrolase n=1 Tax=Lancefieldella sp. Marseille-Q7238 TaxID=3022127 RepID=UPI0024A8B7CD|nr:alpha/beta hydrolase [Lancefieldella sp. Marseille-Q7238]
MIDAHQDKKKVVLLIHPMLLSAKEMKLAMTDYLGGEFRYIIPDLSAHGERSEEPYESAKKESERLHTYLLDHGIEELTLAFGASLGGVVLLQLLAYRDIKVHKAVFEGCSVWQHAKALDCIVRTIFIHQHRKAVRNRSLAIRKMARLYGEKGASMAETFIQIDEQSIKNICHDCAFVNLPVLSEEDQKACLFLYGSKEFDLWAAKKVLPKEYPHARMRIWDGYGHCAKMSADSMGYCNMLRNEIANSNS